MIQHFFKRVLRAAERKSPHPSSAFLAQILRTALAQSGGGRVMHQDPNDPAPRPAAPSTEQPDGIVIPLVPRRSPAPDKTHEPPQPDDDNPGPKAA
jgi:hypothetical protein